MSHWSPERWERLAVAPGRPVSTTRADLVFGLVQELADLAADAEGLPRRPVPRLANNLALPDQLRVMVADLLLAAESRGDSSAADGGQPSEALQAGAALIGKISSIMR